MYFLKTLAYFIGGILLIIVVSIAVFTVWFNILTRPRRGREPGFEYIYVEEDGSARELDDDERVYLKTEFHGGDGNRPYIKLRYESLTPDGKIWGYLRRRQLPNDIEIKPAKAQK